MQSTTSVSGSYLLFLFFFIFRALGSSFLVGKNETVLVQCLLDTLHDNFSLALKKDRVSSAKCHSGSVEDGGSLGRAKVQLQMLFHVSEGPVCSQKDYYNAASPIIALWRVDSCSALQSLRPERICKNRSYRTLQSVILFYSERFSCHHRRL